MQANGIHQVGNHRFVILDNGDGTYSLRDNVEHRWIDGPDGTEDMGWFDVVDLYREYSDPSSTATEPANA